MTSVQSSTESAGAAGCRESRPRVLVTGADGFVGKTVCRKLRDAQCSVRAAVWSAELASLNTGAFPDGVELVVIGDIGANPNWGDLLQGVDAVIHLAARVHVMDEQSPDSIAEYRRVNTKGTEQLAWAAAGQGVRRFVFVSTVKVNGERTLDKPFAEGDQPRPQDAYAVSKWEAERALLDVCAKTGLERVVVRPPLVYGPGVRGNFLRLLKLVYGGLPLPLKSANNRRSLVGVENLADFLMHCARHSGAANQTFLISDGEDVSTAELVRRLAHHLGRRSCLVPCPEIVFGSLCRCVGREELANRLFGSLVVSSHRAREVLGWRQPLSLDEGLAATARWYLESRLGTS